LNEFFHKQDVPIPRFSSPGKIFGGISGKVNDIFQNAGFLGPGKRIFPPPTPASQEFTSSFLRVPWKLP
jgi:hypothetical protein